MRRQRTTAEEWAPPPGIRLSEADKAIVRSDRNLAVRAGPGAGKTELLAQRASYLLQTGICPPPRRILAISFKVDAAANLRNRVRERCGEDLAYRFASLTFDAFAKGLIDRFRAGIEESWRPSNDYTIISPGRRDWEEFLNDTARNEGDDRIRAIASDDFARCHAVRLPLDKRLDELECSHAFGVALLAWWRKRLKTRPSELTFPMIRRLALLMIETNPRVRRLLQATYSHIFLDEFQDTTRDQYDLLHAIFRDSDSILTAVGDKQQAIMGWAGAMKNPFEVFGRDFDAEPISLLTNHRSNRAIVDLINAFRRTIWEDAETVECARKDDPVPDRPTGRKTFDTQEQEAEFLASFIRQEVEAGERDPEDFALLVRIRADQLEERLAHSFAKADLVLRNDARTLGAFSIQDLVKEPLFDYLLALLKLATRVKGGTPYQVAETFLAGVSGTDLGDPRQVKTLQDDLRAAVEAVRRFLDRRTPDQIDEEELMEILRAQLSDTKVRAAIPSLAEEARLREYTNSFKLFLEENAAHAESWPGLFDAMEGKGQVRLMTIHKSKGLEFHTVFFLDLNDESWFSRGEGEDNAFFVALSRARERVFFLNSNIARGSRNLEHLNRALDAANVPVLA